MNSMYCFVWDSEETFPAYSDKKKSHSKEISKDEVIKIVHLKVEGQNPIQISGRIKRSLNYIYKVLRWV